MSRSPVAESSLPVFLRAMSTDEFRPAPFSARDVRVRARALDTIERTADRLGRPVHTLTGSRAATAAGLLALNGEHGARYYDVAPDAARDEQAAVDAFSGPEIVIDVQTHFIAPHCARAYDMSVIVEMYRATMPGWWSDLPDTTAWNLARYLGNVFLETETAVAVLTSGPGHDDTQHLYNDELAATRALIDRLAGTGRLLNHSVVHANVDEEYEAMEEYRDRYSPVGWKVYTLPLETASGPLGGWMLDDDDGLRFLERARALDVKLLCAHKGISFLLDNGSPRDIGPAARAFPDLQFVVYHSGYEMPFYGAALEGPYTEATAHEGVNRLVTSVQEAGIGPGSNVFAELGSTWFALVRRPMEAAHVLGKLVRAVGEDNVLWGTDSIWYGPAQPIVDAFRSFTIPDAMCEEFGYAPLTPEVKEKILGLNAARIYDIDLERVREQVRTDDLAWARAAIEDIGANGFAGLY